MNRSDIEKIRDIFYNVQFNKTFHKKSHDALAELHDKHDLDVFCTEFINCLIIPLRYNEKEPHVHNVLEFAANFIVGYQKMDDSDIDLEETCPFVYKVLNWLLQHHCVKDVSMRYGICTFINTLLNTMTADAYIDDDTWTKIINNMTERLQDKSPKVRAQAVLALRRLQEPKNKECPVIQMFIKHVLKDPSADVRKAILGCMAKTSLTLATVLKKVNDINEDVRKLAYEFVKSISVKSLSIEQREYLLKNGLNDPSEKVQQFVKEKLLPAWLGYYSNDFAKLLKGLDAENCPEMASSCLEILIRNIDLNIPIEQLPMDTSTRVIPVDKLTSENVMLWYHVVKRAKESSLFEFTEELLPELIEFCTYIKKHIKMMDDASSDAEPWETVTQLFILSQLFKMTKFFDLSDEAGRLQLKEVLMQTLLSKYISFNDISENVIQCIVQCMDFVSKVDERVIALTSVISELRTINTEQCSQPEQISKNESDEAKELRTKKKTELRIKLNELNDEQYNAVQDKNFRKAEELKSEIEEIERELRELQKVEDVPEEVDDAEEIHVEEKNDDETLWKCLTIMTQMMQAHSLKQLTPTLRTLMENIVLPNITHQNLAICSLALRILGICCLLDSGLAKNHFITFVLYTSIEGQHEEVFLTSLLAIIDLLVCYGLPHFDVDDVVRIEKVNPKKHKATKLYDRRINELEGTIDEIKNNKESIIMNIIKLLDHQNEEYQRIATEGLCKLLLSGRLSSSNLLCHLIIMLFNPVTERNASLRKTLIYFFNCYVNVVVESQSMLEEAFIPTLRILENAPESSPLEQVDSLKVAEMILGFTSSNALDKSTDDCTVHNNLTFKILNEIVESHFVTDLDVLVKSLKFLNVQFEGDQKDLLLMELHKATETVKDEEPRLLKYMHSFYDRIVGEAEVEEKEPEEVKEEDA